MLALNKQLAYPGAFTLQGTIEGLARGESAKAIHRRAAHRFADAMGKPRGAIRRSLSYGP